MPSSSATAVLFDLDGTLVASEPIVIEALRAGCAKVGLDLPAAKVPALVGRSWVSVFADLGKTLNPTARAHLAHSTLAFYEAHVESGLPPVPGGGRLVRDLHGHTRLAIVTGSTASQLRAAVRQLGIADLLDTVVTEDQVTHGKPDPEGYLTALDRLGVAPRRALVFEDSSVGIAAARAAGCVVVAVRHTRTLHQDVAEAHHAVDDFSAVDRAWCLARIPA